MVKQNERKQFKRIKTPRMSNGTKKRQTKRFSEKFSQKQNAEKCVFQDEKDFTLEIPVDCSTF